MILIYCLQSMCYLFDSYMSLIDRICPEAVAECLRMFLVHFGRKTGKKRKTEANGIEEL